MEGCLLLIHFLDVVKCKHPKGFNVQRPMLQEQVTDSSGGSDRDTIFYQEAEHPGVLDLSSLQRIQEPRKS